MKKLFTGLCLASLLLGGLCQAQQQQQQDRTNIDNAKEGEQAMEPKFWVCIIGGSSSCVTTVRLDTITSASKHSYTVDGVSFREVTIDTRGNNSIRFYACLNERVNTMKERMSNTRALIDSKSGGSTKFPAKKFPEGTYSHNVEYQLDNDSDLNKIYESVVNAMFKNRGCTLKIK